MPLSASVLCSILFCLPLDFQPPPNTLPPPPCTQASPFPFLFIPGVAGACFPITKTGCKIWGSSLPPSETSCLFLLADCREEQYPCTRLYSVHKPCKQCLNEICFYSLRRVYVINKEICVRTVCAHEDVAWLPYRRIWRVSLCWGPAVFRAQVPL
uniref:Microfibril associated protein 2 n=1 Tax=Accipiter nisus TaxID=211598 RepID=A0A8B9RVG6_9AVES